MKSQYSKALLSLPIITIIILAMFLASGIVSADDDTSVVDEINITVPVSCTLSGVGMDTHNATINNGQYNSAIGESTIKAFCNDNNGFSIYAIGYTDNTDGKNVLTNSTLGSTYDIATGTLTTGSNSQWAMKLSTITSPAPTYPIIIAGSTADTEKAQGDPDFTSFQEVPDDYERVAYRTSSTDINPQGQSTAEGSTIKSTYQAYISSTQPAGTYTGQVKYTMVHPYNATTPEKPIVCNPNGTTIGTESDTDIVCLQDFASLSSSTKTTLIGDMTLEQQYTLLDKRDGKTYTLAKLKDGKVWMTQNLDLDLDSTKTYTNEDTDLGWNQATNTYGTASWTPIRSTYETAPNHLHAWCQGGTLNSEDGYCEENNTPESYDPGNLYWNEVASNGSDWDSFTNSCDRSSNPPSCNDELNPLFSYTTIDSSTPQYHLGNYYNWPAAVASNDASVYGVYNDNTDSYENAEPHQSICPAGWTLPFTYYNNIDDQYEGDFADLWYEYGYINDYNHSALWSGPIYFAPVGQYDTFTLELVGSIGNYWSSVAQSEIEGKCAYIGVSGYVSPVEYNERHFGGTVRCLLR